MRMAANRNLGPLSALVGTARGVVGFALSGNRSMRFVAKGPQRNKWTRSYRFADGVGRMV